MNNLHYIFIMLFLGLILGLVGGLVIANIASEHIKDVDRILEILEATPSP